MQASQSRPGFTVFRIHLQRSLVIIHRLFKVVDRLADATMGDQDLRRDLALMGQAGRITLISSHDDSGRRVFFLFEPPRHEVA